MDPPRRDLRVGRSILRFAAERYAAGVSLDDPRLSPVNGSMDGLPAVHLNVGTIDFLRTSAGFGTTSRRRAST